MEAAMPRAFEGRLVTEERRLLLEKRPEAEREKEGDTSFPPSTFPLVDYSQGRVPCWTKQSRERYGLGLREEKFSRASLHVII